MKKCVILELWKLLAFMNNDAAMEKYPFETVFNSSVYILEVQFLSCMVILCLTFCGAIKLLHSGCTILRLY
jgi:hypothetical protein